LKECGDMKITIKNMHSQRGRWEREKKPLLVNANSIGGVGFKNQLHMLWYNINK